MKIYRKTLPPLGAWQGKTEKQIKERLISDFGATREQVEFLKVLVAVWERGCFFLFQDRNTGELLENHGVEFRPEATTLDYLKSDRFNPTNAPNLTYARLVRNYINSLE